MTAKEMFNELTWISDSWDGEYIIFHKDKIEIYLLEFESKLQNTSSNSDYAKCTDELWEHITENIKRGSWVKSSFTEILKKHFTENSRVEE